MAGLSLLCSLVASLHLSRFQKRGKGKSGRFGWRIRTPTWWGCGRRRGGSERGKQRAREGGAGRGRRRRLRLQPPRGAAAERGAPGGCGRGQSRACEPSPGAAETGSAQPSARAVQPLARCSRRSPRSGPHRCSGSPARSVRLLQQLPRVEALGGGKARRREGRGGTNAARSRPRGGAGAAGRAEPPPPDSAARRLRRPPARPRGGACPLGSRRVPESGESRRTETDQCGGPAGCAAPRPAVHSVPFPAPRVPLLPASGGQRWLQRLLLAASRLMGR